jgi:ATP synthase protein I
MTAHDPLQDLKQRLDAAEAERARQQQPSHTVASGYNEDAGRGVRLAVEFIVPIFVGAAVGIWLDRRLETLPWLTVIFVLLGFGAAIMNVFRLAGGYGAVGYRKTTLSTPPEQITDEDQTPRE